MNLIDAFQNLMAQVPELLQPVIVALAGAVPFIEGEGAAVIGIIGGIPPIVAAVAAVVGNFACVAALVLAGSGARRAIVDKSRQRQAAAVGAGAVGRGTEPTGPAEDTTGRGAARRAKFARAFERYGVPGVSLLGPLLLPTQITATMLAASGIGRARILLWQAVAIVGWTTVATVLVTGAVYVIR